MTNRTYINLNRGINERVVELTHLMNIRTKRVQAGRDTARLDAVIEQRRGAAMQMLEDISDG